MAYSTLKLYTNTAVPFTSSQLFMVDDFSTYLSSQSSLTIDNFQYQKPKLNMEIKIVLDESYIWQLKENRYVYLSMLNSDNTRPIYFYIKNLEWTSQNCVKLTLLMDVLNSFAIGTDYALTPKTLIKRQHKNRVSVRKIQKRELVHDDLDPTGSTFDSYTITNEYDENLEVTAIQIGFWDVKIYYKDRFGNWYVGRTIDDVYRIAESKIQYGDYTYYRYEFYQNQEQEPTYEFFGGPDETTSRCYVEIESRLSGISSGIEYITGRFTVTTHLVSSYSRIIDKISENINPTLYHQISSDQEINDLYSRNQNWYIVFINDNDISSTATEVDYNNPVSCYVLPESTTPVYIGGVNYSVDSISKLDRTNSRLIKVIKLPYLPIEVIANSKNQIRISGDLYDSGILPTGTTATMTGIKIKSFSAHPKAFKHILENTGITSPVYSVYNVGSPIYTKFDARNETFESKLYHSEFYLPKLYYDSFSFAYRMENITRDNGIPNEIDITFYTTSTINSNFSFKIGDYVVYRAEEDYYNWLIVSRNNEIPLLNVAYMNYIRSGYNYDVKSKNASNFMTWLGTGTSLIGTMATWISAIATEGMTIPLAIGMSTSTIMSFANSINTSLQNENNMQSKLAQLKMQSASVYGSDDVDLMSEYSNNRLRLTLYKPSDEIQALIKDLFFYTGYIDNTYGVPDLDTRIHFNFLQCEPNIKYLSSNITSEIQNEIEAIMKVGFTKIHKVVNNNNVATWDFEQIFENYETLLF